MAAAEPGQELEELERADEILLHELRHVDEMLLEELERVDDMFLRIAAAIDQLPERIASNIRRERVASSSGNGTRGPEPARSRDSTRPFDPYGEDEVEVAEAKTSAARRAARKARHWVAAYTPDREALRFASLSLAVAVLAAIIAVVSLTVAAFL